MASVRILEVDGFEFTAFFFTGSFLEDGIVIPPSQELTPSYLKAFETARYIYPYHRAEVALMHSGGYWLEQEGAGQIIKTIHEGQRLGILEATPQVEHAINMVTSTRYRNQYLQRQNQAERQAKSQRLKEAGYVYLIQSSEGYYKIGKAKNLPTRIKALGVQLPFPIELVHSIKSDDYTQLEKDLHARFADKRGRGEWFALSPDDIEFIRGL